MSSAAKLVSESSKTGTLPPTDNSPKSSGNVLFFEFGVPASRPLRGGVALGDVMRRLELDAGMAPRLARARQSLAQVLGSERKTLRDLRLAAGMSQAKLAERAGATQSYIARVEAGTVDPGTDMLARLAQALGVPDVDVFGAVRTQRESLNE